jgi:ADP-ribosylglycohydrolase
MRLSWVQPEDLLTHEFVASSGEGRTIADLIERWLAAGGSVDAPVSGSSAAPASPALRALAGDLLTEIAERPVDPVLAAEEPSGWEAIGALVRPVPPRPVPGGLDPDRILGAWQGRAAGCLLGKPVEKIPRAGIREILTAADRWPLAGYFTAVGLPAEVAARWPWNRRSASNSLAENISGMPEDDDLNFPMLALAVLERLGPAPETADTVDTGDLAQAWLDLLPAGRVFTAERVAYRNLLDGVTPPRTAAVGNPYREWIGAAIRGDVWGWVHAGDPWRAAESAFRDARLSHTRNGIYGEMFTAALCALAPVASSIEEVLTGALSTIPPGSRLAQAIRLGIRLGAAANTELETCLDEIATAYGRLHWVHVLPNLCLTAFALARSRGEFVPAVCTVVTGGWDTDSNGATVGSVCGALAGSSGLPAGWIDPLRDRIASSVPGFDGVAITELADRTVALARRFAPTPGVTPTTAVGA